MPTDMPIVAGPPAWHELDWRFMARRHSSFRCISHPSTRERASGCGRWASTSWTSRATRQPRSSARRSAISRSSNESFHPEADTSDLPPTLASFCPAGSVLLSSRKDTTRYATALVLDSAGTLRMVAKIVRRPRHQERLAAEFELLRFLADRYAGAPIAPHPIALVQHRDHWMLLETALDAKFLRRGRARSHRRTWERVEAWLLDLASTAATVDKAWHDEQIADPLERLEQTLPASEAEEQLFAETRALTLELTRLSVPAPLEHDDLFRTHLGIRRDGSLAAIDWELGRCAGLAAADATIFLLDLFSPPAGGLAGEAGARAYGELSPPAGPGEAVARRAPRTPKRRAALVNHILLATLARRALHIWEPVVAETREASTQLYDHARSRFRAFWAVRLCRMTLEQMSKPPGAPRPVAPPSGIG